MYSCSHLNSFLSQVRERIVIGAMSKQGQNTTSNGGSPTAKARLVNLVMRSQYKEETSSSSLGSRVSLGNDDERKRVGQAPGNWDARIKPKERVQEILQAHGNLLHAHQSLETWTAQTIDTWRRSFNIWRRSWECLQSMQHFQWIHTGPMC